MVTTGFASCSKVLYCIAMYYLVMLLLCTYCYVPIILYIYAQSKFCYVLLSNVTIPDKLKFTEVFMHTKILLYIDFKSAEIINTVQSIFIILLALHFFWQPSCQQCIPYYTSTMSHNTF